MNIAVLSGKGGTGKTFVSVNLASAIKNSAYIDCDVEEPNGHLFFKPTDIKKDKVFVKFPKFDDTKCIGCRACVDFCEFNALAFVNNKPLLFSGVCHSCGGCKLVCKQDAVTEEDHSIGEVFLGKHNTISVFGGKLNTGEESGVPIIRQLLLHPKKDINVYDCPPGSACSVMESIKDADYCILVAEPTVFGLHNFEMVYELVRIMNKPFAVVINKESSLDNPMENYCTKNKLPVLARIPYSLSLAKANAVGKIAYENEDEIKDIFDSIYRKILEATK